MEQPTSKATSPRRPAGHTKAGTSTSGDLQIESKSPPSKVREASSGTNLLRGYLKSREDFGVNHISLNLPFSQADIEMTMKRLADELLPDFHEQSRDTFNAFC